MAVSRGGPLSARGGGCLPKGECLLGGGVVSVCPRGWGGVCLPGVGVSAGGCTPPAL